MKIPTALDFAALYEDVTEVGIIEPQLVAAKLREIADLLEQKQAPKLQLLEAHSMQSAITQEFFNTVLILRFRGIYPTQTFAFPSS